MVARLDVTEPRRGTGAQALSRADVLPYADAVVRRVRRGLAEYWLAIGRGTAAAHAFGSRAGEAAQPARELTVGRQPLAGVAVGEAAR